MSKKLSLLLISLFTITVSFYSCKKDKPNEQTLIGTWELSKITFVETNVSYPLDSFRNVISASLVFKSDSSFFKTDNFGRVEILPLTSNALSLREFYNQPRHPKARFIIVNGYQELPITSSKFSVKNNQIYFETEYVDANMIRHNRFDNQFELKNNSALEIYNENLLIYNQQSNSYTTYKLKFLYKRKTF